MRQFVAETGPPLLLRAWLNPENPNDDIMNPQTPRQDGWRVVIERKGQSEPVRSTWESTIVEAMRHVSSRWPTEPMWLDHATGEPVDMLGL